MRDTVRPAVALAVFLRDQGCVAPRLGGTYHDCWGVNGLEHVKAEPRMARRAPSCLCGLVTLCEGHREPGMKAGYVWCTANRQACRDYLAAFGYGPHTSDHMERLAAA